MKNLITIEWMKLRRLMTMKVILIVYAIMVPLIFWAISYISIRVGPGTEVSLPSSMYQFPEVYNYVGYIASFFNLMIGVIVIVFTTNELKYKTQRQNVIDGLNKREVIMAKFYVVFLLAFAISFYAFLVSLIFGAINGNIGDLFDGIQHVGAYFVSTFGYFIFALFFANLVRLPALAIVLYLVSTTVEGIIGFITTNMYVQFFPLSTFADLVPIPILPDGAPEFIWGQGGRVLLALGYILILVIISYRVIKKRDI
ncbi:MAG: ABC-2 type transport system permease protein [Flavobacteriaceae bacterium]|jgi:ABC-2 type transport system permease protein